MVVLPMGWERTSSTTREIKYDTCCRAICAIVFSSCTPLRKRRGPHGGVGRGWDDNLPPLAQVAFTSCPSFDKWLKLRTNFEYCIFYVRPGMLSHAVGIKGYLVLLETSIASGCLSRQVKEGKQVFKKPCRPYTRPIPAPDYYIGFVGAKRSRKRG